jgi:hypothetical protein
MNHEFKGKPSYIGESMYEITVSLIPENPTETKAIYNLEIGKANETEKELINNYLLFGISGWSTLSIKSQTGSIFKLKATNS